MNEVINRPQNKPCITCIQTNLQLLSKSENSSKKNTFAVL
jgi:hypothetical protein